MRVKEKKEEKRLLSRRNFVLGTGALAAGATMVGGLLIGSKTRAQVPPPPPPWDTHCDLPVSPVTKYPELVYPAGGLDPVAVGTAAGNVFGDLHCGEAPFWAIVNALGLECQIPISILTPLGHAGM
ncbi:MAG: hypothetical protein HZA12_03680, partial [Nitrospirae bacterium]|nr:hypothetical protein [Nitrospirota bacterium]